MLENGNGKDKQPEHVHGLKNTPYRCPGTFLRVKNFGFVTGVNQSVGVIMHFFFFYVYFGITSDSLSMISLT